MAISYTIPPWLGPQAAATWGNLYSVGQRLGLEKQRLNQAAAEAAARTMLQRQKLQQDAALAQIQMQAREEQLQRESLRRQQELEIDAAYKDVLIGVREREAETRAARAQAQIEQSIRRYGASQALARIMAASGGKVTAEVLSAAAEAGATPGQMGSLFRASMPKTPGVPSELEEFTSKGGRSFVKITNPNTGSITVHPSDSPEQFYRVNYPGTKGDPGAPKLGIPATIAVPGTNMTYRVPSAAVKPNRTPSAKAIAYLREHPDTAAQFDQWYGEGASDQYQPAEETEAEE